MQHCQRAANLAAKRRYDYCQLTISNCWPAIKIEPIHSLCVSSVRRNAARTPNSTKRSCFELRARDRAIGEAAFPFGSFQWSNSQQPRLAGLFTYKFRGVASIVIELNRTESVAREGAVLVGVVLPDHPASEYPLEELEGLATTAGVRIVGKLTQRRDVPDMTPISVKARSRSSAAGGRERCRCVIFDNDLSPAQTRNLEKADGREGARSHRADSRHLRHASQTHEARLAVELAQLAILAAAAEADVDALVAHQGRHRHARPGRKAARSRPPTGREPHPRARSELSGDPAPQGARGRRAAAIA